MNSSEILIGIWGNGHDSEMVISGATDGIISGTYKSNVSREGGSLVAKSFTGSYSRTDYGLLIAFIAHWQYTDKDGDEHWSCTSWSGQIWSDDLESMDSTWILSSAIAKKDSWRSVLTNKDVFTKII